MKLLSFLKKEPILAISALAAAVSCFFVPPDAGYLGYIDFRTLALLYSLMLVVAGLRTAGAFEALAHRVCRRAGSARRLGLLLTILSFFSSMLITNDVALLTFVPFAVVLLGMTGREKDLLGVVVLQTAAANLGSMLTPVGNPQNLYLYSRYELGAGEFFRITGPVWGLSLGLILLLCLGLPGTALRPVPEEATKVDGKKLLLYLALFALCLSSVFRLLPWPLLLLGMAGALLVFDRRMLLAADFCLLLTFAAFFVFAGNLARLGAVEALLRRLLSGREYLTALLTSQLISNVPAALLLSGFTEEARELLLGVDIGGLGTPIASLASLISLKLYSRSPGARTGRFLGLFLGVNLLLLVLLSAAHLLLGQVF
ncbi:MAG: citrate transporter [Oscillospiraceae bacterium]|nr:citrate transporter [Oscillospiraceae bacterium]